MLTNIFTKSVRDRQLATLIGGLGIASVALMGLAAYSDLDEAIAELYGSMPESFLAILGLGDISNAGTLIIGEIVNLMGPLVLAGLAISMGTGAVAGEERRRTLGVLLGNPKSRSRVVLSKSAAMVVLIAVGAIVAWAGSLATAIAFGTDMTGLHFGAGMFHVAVVALLFGFFALLLGSWTGNGTLSSGVAVGWLLISFLAAGLLPLVEGLAEWARLFPWYYFNASQPLLNGIDWGHIGVLVAAIGLFLWGALIGVNRRDLKVGEGHGTLIQRLRSHSVTEKIVGRLQGRAKVSSVVAKTASENQMLALIAGLVVLYTALLVGPLYNGISDVLKEFSEMMPEALLAMIGGVDMGRPEGWYQAEVFSITAPAAVIVVTAVMGAKALAGEEQDHTMDLLLANPINRSKVVVEKAIAIAIIGLGLGLATFVGTMAGSLIGGLGLVWVNVAGTSLLLALLGMLFGYVALAVSSGTGSRRAAVLTASAVAFFAYFANAFLPVSATLSEWARLSPFHYYGDGTPLVHGLEWGNAAMLLVLCVLVVALSVPLFQRRDIRA